MWRQMNLNKLAEPETDLEPLRIRALAVGAQAIGAVALGTLALGAVALGVVAIGRLVISRARIKRQYPPHDSTGKSPDRERKPGPKKMRGVEFRPHVILRMIRLRLLGVSVSGGLPAPMAACSVARFAGVLCKAPASGRGKKLPPRRPKPAGAAIGR